MPTLPEYAQLANRVYLRTDENRTPVPIGWTEVQWFADRALTGFSAGVYRKGEEIVISYTGTNEQKVKDFSVANLPAAGPIPSAQVWEAMEIYLEVRKANPQATISFTGHSLGGGLASMMAVFFDCRATTFDAAPFELGAKSLIALATYRAQMAFHGYSDAKFDAYGAGEVFAQREALVAGYWLQGEALAYLRAAWPVIVNPLQSSGEIGVGDQTILHGSPLSVTASSVDLHSMTMLAAMLSSGQFASAVRASSNLLGLLFDNALYNRDPQTSATPNFIDLLYVAQVGVERIPLLDRFGADMLKLAVLGGATSQPSILKALTVAAMEYYYFKDPAAAISLFTVSGNALHFSYNDIGASSYKSLPLLSDAASSTVLGSDPFIAPAGLRRATDWHIQSGTGSMVWQSTNAADDAAIGGSAADVLRSGAGNDVLIGGGGDDFLEGGSGRDTLLGGAGQDRYEFAGSFGVDSIIDSDGRGLIVLGDSQLPSGKLFSDNVWVSEDQRITYTLVDGDLLIAARGTADGPILGTITVRDWSTGQLGITLDNQPAPQTPPSRVFNGDYHKKFSDAGLEWDADHNYVADGAEANAQDVIHGTSANDLITGVGGSDGLAGFDGDDSIDGGDGEDLLLGGFGHDTIRGGAGADEILGSGGGGIWQPQVAKVWTSLPAHLQLLARGFSWQIVQYNGTYQIEGSEPTPVAETTGNLIYGDAGDDRIGAGKGADTVHGGADSDHIVGMGGSDLLFGDEGDDAMEGDGGPLPYYYLWTTEPAEHAGDVMDGGEGNDTLVGEGGDDVLIGGAGSDRLYGDDAARWRTPLALNGSDYLDGGDGDDTVVGDGRDDQLFGGAGNDLLHGDGYFSANDVPPEYEGEDYLDGEDGNDTLVGGGMADELFGGDGNDVLMGDAATTALAQQVGDYLDGEAGDDELHGFGGDDELFGGLGADTLLGYDGADFMDGEEGDDLAFGGADNDTLYGGDGRDQLQGGVGDDFAYGGEGGDLLMGDAGNDSLSGDAGDDNVQGGDGLDTLDGGEGIDKIFGEAGNDLLRGGEGADVLVGESGADVLYGDAGNDELQAGADADTLYGGMGDDLLFAEAGDDLAMGGDGNDVVQGGDGTDALFGGTGDDILTGDAGNDTLSGDEGRDELQGGTGADSLSGGTDNDVLFGSADADTLDGGSGDDVLQGDDGADVYYFGRGSGKDTIYNWELNGGSIDVLQFASDVKSTDVIAWQQGADQVFAIRGTDDSVTVKNYWAPTRSYVVGGTTLYHYDYRVEQVKFADGITWTPSNTPTFYQAKAGGSITSAPGTSNNVFSGTSANDYFLGVYGADTYLWEPHSGRDMIDGHPLSGHVDKVRVDAGIKPADVLLAKLGNDAVLRLRNAPDEVAILGGALAPAGTWKVVFEADGTVWDLAQQIASMPASAPLSAPASAPASELTSEPLAALAAMPPAPPPDSLQTLQSAQLQIAQPAAKPAPSPTPAPGPTPAPAPGTILGTSRNDTLQGTTGADSISGLAGSDTLRGLGGADTLDGGLGNDSLLGGPGDDIYIVDSTTDAVVELANEGIDTIRTTIALATLAANVENLTLLGTVTTATGNALNNVITGNAQVNTLNGGAGNDTMIGGAGNDTFVVTEAGDVVVENAGEGVDTVQSNITYTLGAEVENLTLTGTAAINATGNAGNNVLTGNSANNVLTGGEGNDTLDGAGGADTLVGGLGDDSYTVSSSTTVIVELAGEGSDTVQSSVTFSLAGFTGASIENLTLIGTGAVNATGDANANVVRGNEAANILDGGLGIDTLWGAGGNDTLYGRDNDELHGGAGDDTYNLVGAGGANFDYRDYTNRPTVYESDGSGIDTVIADFSLQLWSSYYWSNADSAYHYVGTLENATLLGTGNWGVEGSDSANVITGNSGNNNLMGQRGADTIDGGAGNDTVRGGNGSLLIGGAGDDRLGTIYYGDSVTMRGGTGDDRYVLEYGGTSVIVENANEGIDTLEIVAQYEALNYTMVANLENLSVSGSYAAVTVIGNALDNQIASSAANVSAGAGNDTLRSFYGTDTLAGGLGNDVYQIGSTDLLVEAANEGIDTVEANFSFVLAANFENLTLTGSSAINGTGNAANNVLTGNSAANVLTGGLGDDTYVVNYGDTVVENAGEGNDTIRAAESWSLASFANIENLELTGTANLTATGNASNNVLTGNAGANTIDGGAGADTMKGGTGDDLYIVDNALDVIVENAGEGTDTVQSAVTYTLAANIEHLVLTGSGSINGTGNAQDNMLTGNAGANVLSGGAGNDTYVITETQDTVVEAAAAGIDTVQSTISYTLGANVENLVLTGGDINGTGNALANTLTGSSGANVLAGGAGDDVYVVGFGDTVVENANEGVDTVRAAGSWTLGANIENLVLLGGNASGTGNALANAITGTFLNNTLDGGAGVDTLAGGGGDDLYIVDNAGDTVVENASEGSDTVQSSVTFTLAANVESLLLTGSAAIDGTGNALANTIAGNSANNRLAGGAGDDLYIADALDTIVEVASEGNDTVQTAATNFTLAVNVENLTLTGAAGSGVGNAGDNTLTSQGASAHTLFGGLGNDTYVIGFEDVVQENAGEGIDTVVIGASYTLGANLENLTLTGSGNLNATGNALDNTLTGNAGANVLTGGAGDDTYVVDAYDTVVELEGEGTDTIRSAISQMLGANLENLVLTGSAAVNGTGNSLANSIVGNAGNNLLDGQDGIDTIAGGAGDDTYVAADALDLFIELAGEGSDIVMANVDFTLGANVENLQLTGTALAGTGNELANRLTGNVQDNALSGGAGNDTLDGGMGADTLNGGTGDDTFVIDNLLDVVVEAAGEGNDTVMSRIDHTLGDNLEHLTLAGYAAYAATGNAANNVITGNWIANLLDGGAGADTLRGGEGDDIYIVDNTFDVVEENANEGKDSVQSSVSFMLGAELENLTLTGTAVINGTGNNAANVLIGNAASNLLAGGSGDDTLDGGLGADTLSGGTGRDTYVVDNALDAIVADGVQGDGDTAISSIDFTLAADLENLQLTGTATRATGNAQDNLLIGNGVANLLDGGSGADTMLGGLGDDTYIVESAGDWVGEYAGEGFDTIQLAAGISAANVQLVRSGTSLVLKINGTASQIQLATDLDATDTVLIEEIRFTDDPVTVIGVAEAAAVA